jgi:hypothetical protein
VSGGTLKWFGPTWGAPVNDPADEIPVPVGKMCARDDGLFNNGDRGVAVPYMGIEESSVLYYHLKCWFDELGIDYPPKPE